MSTLQADPLVSILIPLYNAEAYFSETMESLLAQTYKNIEIIIVNDGSIDNSLKIARQYERQYTYIKVYTQTNSGGQVARNKAFKMSKGEYIQYFDADDIMHPDKIASQMDVLREYGFQDDIVATGKWMMFFNSIDNTFLKEQTINKNYDDKFLFFKEAWMNKEFMIGQAWLISRKMCEKTGDWNILLSKNQDGEFFTRVAYNANKILFVEESIVYWRRGVENSVTSSRSFNAMRSDLNSYHTYYNLVKNDLNKYPLHKEISTLYSSFYEKYFPLDKQTKKDVYGKLKSLGYHQPIIEFNPKFSWIVKLFGVDAGLHLRRVKSKFVTRIKKES